MSHAGRETRLLVQVVSAQLEESPHGGRHGQRWWALKLRCGHVVERGAQYAARSTRRRRGQPVRRTRDEVRPAPRNARCDECPRVPLD